MNGLRPESPDLQKRLAEEIARPQGLIAGIDALEPGIPGAVLLRARFRPGRYRPELFRELDLDRPEQLARAMPKRCCEYLAGRLLARAALAALGHPGGPVLPGPGRAPVWPAGAAGSISHSADICACLALHMAGKPVHPGVDVETVADARNLDAILKLCCTPVDRALIAADPDRTALRATLLFSAKEALYKALYPVFREVAPFEAAELTASPSDGLLHLRLTAELHPSLPAGRVFALRYLTWTATAQDSGQEHGDRQVLTWILHEPQQPGPKPKT
ncbi:4'-phosphopantetheinyl transferase family protein [Rhodovulum sulfidophilum]|uniref:Enterobactin synthase component D n=1 Tax=Rhodovulum sulfidophilum TaxID=35806 RepID=A0ABS1RRV0_RHOSU|nr:4'-phosphopantetheinyl transferase superfamily protein [Rhodovulum sulfidophilum]MBL3608796.1 4'-phosphopantetheinyl transferase superfamily protein [Rhodovulum sulfidophilum]MCE8457177.1 4'-phosphopantetheinyl transferase superfamily protein [Rhodovulum sulfidophilum]